MKNVYTLLLSMVALSALADAPHYKPSSRSAEAVDITTNAYGGSELAPRALAIGEIAPGFELQTAAGEVIRLDDHPGNQALIFYRGHW